MPVIVDWRLEKLCGFARPEYRQRKQARAHQGKGRGLGYGRGRVGAIGGYIARIGARCSGCSETNIRGGVKLIVVLYEISRALTRDRKIERTFELRSTSTVAATSAINRVHPISRPVCVNGASGRALQYETNR
jgi:hypothetical protein